CDDARTLTGIVADFSVSDGIEPEPQPDAEVQVLGESIADDLKLINGIKTGIERRLHSVGIRTYAKIATMTPAELAAAAGMPGYSAERIAKQDWVGQARDLAGLPLPD